LKAAALDISVQLNVMAAKAAINDNNRQARFEG
jgi:hypothetical protein